MAIWETSSRNCTVIISHYVKVRKTVTGSQKTKIWLDRTKKNQKFQVLNITRKKTPDLD